MRRCLQLAVLGKGRVKTNPLVGAVIVHEDSIIGEGYHEKYGEAHAEVNAIQSVKDVSLLKHSTMYVNLEPCAHVGKTPPCADLIVQHQFKRVVIGCVDTFSEVSGKGIERLKNAGIDVTIDILRDECRMINRRFFTFHEKNRPFILLKWAETKNGLIDNAQTPSGEISWISARDTQLRVHQWRSENMAILVGKNTVISDNPSLTVRRVSGPSPIRIVLDRTAALNIEEYRINDGKAKTYIFNEKRSGKHQHVEYIQLDHLGPEQLLFTLRKLGIQSIMVEGGATTLQSFIDTDFWDEAIIIRGETSFEKGTAAPQIKGELYRQESFFSDTINYCRP